MGSWQPRQGGASKLQPPERLAEALSERNDFSCKCLYFNRIDEFWQRMGKIAVRTSAELSAGGIPATALSKLSPRP